MDETASIPIGGRPINTAPRHREIEVWNGFYGWYRTKYENGEWPKRGAPGWPDGVWYPVPSFWRELPSLPN